MRPLTIILVLLTTAAHAEVRITLPLQGYHRPGFAMPVRVEGSTDRPVIELGGDGALGARVYPSGGQVAAVVLVVAARPLDALRVDDGTVATPLRPLPDDVRLIGSALETTQSSSAPAAKSVVVPLDPLDPVPGPAMAWEAMDELHIDAAGAARLGEPKLLDLLAVGVDVIVPGDAKPDGPLPWRREGDRWTLRYDPLGPRGSVFSPAMLPVAGWQPGMDAAVRRQALLAAALFAIGATAVAMWRSRQAVLALAALVAVTVVALRVWESRQAPIRWAEGTVDIDGGLFRQRDTWRYVFATELREGRLPVGARVIAESPEALLDQPSVFEHRIPRGRRVAIFWRTLATHPTTRAIDPTVTSPLAPLVKAGYLRPGVTIVGQITEQHWPTVVLRAGEP